MPPWAEPNLPSSGVSLAPVQSELDPRLGWNRYFDLAPSVLLGETGFDERRNHGPPLLIGRDLAGQGVVERPAGGTRMADEVLQLSGGGVESEPERTELDGFGHRHSPICWPSVAWVGTL